jgi:hypothetical protein
VVGPALPGNIKRKVTASVRGVRSIGGR